MRSRPGRVTRPQPARRPGGQEARSPQPESTELRRRAGGRTPSHEPGSRGLGSRSCGRPKPMETPRIPSAAHEHQESRPPRDVKCPQAKECPPGTRDGTSLSSAVHPAPRPRQRRDKRAPNQGPGVQPGFPRRLPTPQAAVTTACSGLQRGRLPHRQQKVKPPVVKRLRPSTSSVSPQRPAATGSDRHTAPGARHPRLWSAQSGLKAARPHNPVLWGGGLRGSALQAPWNRTVALRHGRAGTPRDSWVRGQSAPLECFRGPHVGKQTLSARSI